ncbi:hypothetical protein VTJ04DRAFT_8234 [Mycothermus thermophilus]|uniref:uncharacterized protein n=1 Tax=Humicola insolens TaxID=85995 RepID=UPI003743CBBD
MAKSPDLIGYNARNGAFGECDVGPLGQRCLHCPASLMLPRTLFHASMPPHADAADDEALKPHAEGRPTTKLITKEARLVPAKSKHPYYNFNGGLRGRWRPRTTWNTES